VDGHGGGRVGRRKNIRHNGARVVIMDVGRPVESFFSLSKVKVGPISCRALPAYRY